MKYFNEGVYWRFRSLSDQLCAEHHLTVIKNPQGKTPRSIYFAEKNGDSTTFHLMDEGKIAFSVGVELSYLPPEIQQELFEIIDREDCTPSYSQAFRLHKSFNNCSLTREGLAAVMSEEKPNQKEKVSFKYDDLRKYFPGSYSVGDIQRYILNLVAKDYQRQHNRNRGGDAR